MGFEIRFTNIETESVCVEPRTHFRASKVPILAQDVILSQCQYRFSIEKSRLLMFALFAFFLSLY